MNHGTVRAETNCRAVAALWRGCGRVAVLLDQHRVIDPEHISTSYIERQNLTMRMSMRRFTRLTNAFSKKFENHCHMVALYAAWYTFVRIHKTLRCSPAMAAGVVDTLWSLEDIVRIVDEWESKAKEGE